MSDSRRYHSFILRANGKIEALPPSSKAPSYDVLSKAVGGMIETIPHWTTFEHLGVRYTRGVAYCNENGLTERRPYNPLATHCWRHACPLGDPSRMTLLGDVIFYAKEPRATKVESAQ